MKRRDQQISGENGIMTEVKLMWLLRKGFKTKEELANEIKRSYVGEVTPF